MHTYIAVVDVYYTNGIRIIGKVLKVKAKGTYQALLLALNYGKKEVEKVEVTHLERED